MRKSPLGSNLKIKQSVTVLFPTGIFHGAYNLALEDEDKRMHRPCQSIHVAIILKSRCRKILLTGVTNES